MKKLLLISLFWLAIPSQGFSWGSYTWNSYSGTPPYYTQEGPTWCVHACMQMLGRFSTQWESVCIYYRYFKGTDISGWEYSPYLDAGVYLNDIRAFTGYGDTVLSWSFNIFHYTYNPIWDAFTPHVPRRLPGILIEVQGSEAHASVVHKITHFEDGNKQEHWFDIHDPFYGPNLQIMIKHAGSTDMDDAMLREKLYLFAA